ncbi:MAG: hypothetical protein KDI83_04990 [Gammaproteobacteria bacterium]|nr:hypothetical protein [Gammaproteobacteria bacterium]
MSKKAFAFLGIAGSIASIIGLIGLFKGGEKLDADNVRKHDTNIHLGSGDIITAERDAIINKGVPESLIALWTRELEAQGIQQAQMLSIVQKMQVDFIKLRSDLRRRSIPETSLNNVLTDIDNGELSTAEESLRNLLDDQLSRRLFSEAAQTARDISRLAGLQMDESARDNYAMLAEQYADGPSVEESNSTLETLVIPSSERYSVNLEKKTYASGVHNRSPLLQPGKRTIYQRVLMRPGARLYRNPKGTSLSADAFSRIYVYDRRKYGVKEWLKVGLGTQGRDILGWVLADQTVPWNYQLTLAPTVDRTSSKSLLFFRTREDLKQSLAREEPGQFAESMYERVVTVEPNVFDGIKHSFYLLPILDHEETFLPDGHIAHLLKVAFVAKNVNKNPSGAFEAWICDRDIADPRKSIVEVRVLLSKNQLFDLEITLKKILEGAKKGMIRPGRFFDSVRSVVALFVRDPNLARGSKATRLAELGVLDEYLEDLPYRSMIMAMSTDAWLSMSIAEQNNLVERIEAKIQLYKQWKADPSLWLKLSDKGADASGELVYAIPLEDLP